MRAASPDCRRPQAAGWGPAPHGWRRPTGSGGPGGARGRRQREQRRATCCGGSRWARWRAGGLVRVAGARAAEGHRARDLSPPSARPPMRKRGPCPPPPPRPRRRLPKIPAGGGGAEGDSRGPGPEGGSPPTSRHLGAPHCPPRAAPRVCHGPTSRIQRALAGSFMCTSLNRSDPGPDFWGLRLSWKRPTVNQTQDLR